MKKNIILIIAICGIILIGTIILVQKSIKMTSKKKSDVFYQTLKKGEHIEIPTENENIKIIYDKIELYYINDIYTGFDGYKDSHFYMDQLITYDNLSDESKLYYAYKNIKKIDRKWFDKCDSLEGYKYNETDLYEICTTNQNMIKKDSGSDEWFFYKVTKQELAASYSEVFGENKKMPLKNFTMSYSGMCLYSNKKDDYLCFNLTGSDPTIDKAETKIERAIKYHDYIEIYDRYIWIDFKEGEREYIKEYYKSRRKDELITTEISNNESTSEDIFNDGALYKHTFKLDSNNNYYWYSSERLD